MQARFLDYFGGDFTAFCRTRAFDRTYQVTVKWFHEPGGPGGSANFNSPLTIHLNSAYYPPEQEFSTSHPRYYDLVNTTLHELFHLADYARGWWYKLQIALWRLWPYLEHHHEIRAEERAVALTDIWRDQPK